MRLSWKAPCAQVISTARTCNLILIVLDCLKPISHKKLIEHELEGFGIRLNKQPPQIHFRKKDKGGIAFTTQVPNPKLDLEGSHQSLLTWPASSATDPAKRVAPLQLAQQSARSIRSTTQTSSSRRIPTWTIWCARCHCHATCTCVTRTWT